MSEFTPFNPGKPERTQIDLPDTQDPIELAKAGVPYLLKRAIELAVDSDKLAAISGVLQICLDRAYGKPAQAMTVNSHITGDKLIPDKLVIELVSPRPAMLQHGDVIDHDRTITLNS